MLESLRKSATGWVAKIFIGLLVISFAIWGIADIFRGYGATTVAKIGETEIPAEAFRIAYNNELRALGQRMRRPVTAQEAVAVGLPNQVLGRLVNDALLNEEARKLNLGLSDEALAKDVRSDPNLRGVDGKFDRERFRDILYNNGINEDFYLVQRRQQNLRFQLSEAVAGGVNTPDAYLEAFNQFQNETRVIGYIKIDPSAAGDIADPTPEDLVKYFEANKQKFRAPEYRKFSYLSVDPASVAKPEDVSEDDIQAGYENAGTKYLTPEKRAIRQIVFPSPEEAKTAHEKIRNGSSSFDEIVIERGLKAEDVDLGLITKAEVIDSAVGEAAFKLEKSAVSEVINGRFGSILVRVTDIQPESRTPIEEVRDEIAKAVALKLAENEVLQIHDEIEDARAGGATLEEVATRFGLKLVTVDGVDQSARSRDEKVIELPESRQLLEAVFESDVGVENDPLHQSRGFLWYDVTEVIPARDRTLEEAMEKVVAGWMQSERDSRLGAKIKEYLDQIKAGATLEKIAAEIGTEVKTSPELKRNTPVEGEDIPLTVINAAFQGPQDYVTSVVGEKGARYILQVREISPVIFFAEAEDVIRIRDQIDQQIASTMLSQYVTGLRQDIKVEINQPTIARAIGINQLQ